MMMNRNKRGLALDLKQQSACDALLKLIKTADVVIENYRIGTMEKLGLSYDTLKAINPGLIYCEVSGFGRTGPYKTRGGFDLIAQGMSGLMSITGEGPDRPPVKVGAPISDITAGIIAAMGVVAAYTHRLKTGEGQRVDTSLFEAAITHTYWQSAICFATGQAPGPMGSAHPLNAPYQSFKSKDGWINIGAANQKNWEALLSVIGACELNDDKRFHSNEARQNNLEALVEIIDDHIGKKTTEEWIGLLEAAGVPAGPVLDIAQMHRDPQVIAREMVTQVEHPVAGSVKTIGLPVKFSKTPGKVTDAAPLYGQHTCEVLEELGLGSEAIAEMLATKAAICA
jgi:crotonobetainyl-CoA:carnitine CoA-transferase CaiB-like acyl-CoA transferase